MPHAGKIKGVQRCQPSAMCTNRIECWGEAQDYVGVTVAEANIDPLSQQDIGEWLSGAIQTKWPCL